MSGWTKYRKAIRDQLGAQSKRVLVVEGPDDKDFVESLLTNRAPGQWQANWFVGEAGGKRNIRDLLRGEPTWFALVDRDEWTSADVSAQRTAFPHQLHVLPRYCMESYFTVPSELWAMLEPAQQAHFARGLPEFETALTTSLPQWVRHGALWHTVNPLWAGIRALGFKEALLEFTASQQKDADIEATVNLLLNDYVREFIGKLEEKHRQLTSVTLNESARPGDRAKATKELGKIDKMLKELRAWERDVLLHLAQQRIEIDLDDGVKVNYLKFKGAVVPIPGLEKTEEE